MIPEVVAEAARRFGPTAAFVDADGTPLSYADLDARSSALAAALRASGIGEGAVVGLTLPSTAAYVVAYIGAAKAGAITAGINPRLTGPEQQACIDIVDPALVISSADEVERLVVDGAGRSRPELTEDIDRPVVVVFTSGTTGLPRGAIFTNRQLAAVTRIDVADRWGDGSTMPMLAGTQFAHVGFTTKLPWYLRLGSTTHLLPRWRAADVLELAERVRLPMLGGVAAQIALLLRDPSFDERDLSSVQQLVVGGGPSAPALVAEARRRFGADYSIRYSSTESGGVGTGTAFDADEHEALETVGRPRGEVEVEIRSVDGGGEVVTDGEVGEVHLRSGAVMSGYWGDAEATAHALPGDGWLRTGDLGRIDETGCLVLAGRAKEMFIRGGYNVYPMEVEAVLGQHPAVADVAVVPRPDLVMGELGVAAIVAADPAAPPALADLRAFAGDRLASYKLPDDVVVVDELPLTPGQKIDRKALTAILEDGPTGSR
ncbi:MAG: acyl--CoA ligase [Acidimicrobiia bacterium]|nr:acyl--CoA ligase [Acidimicrobiia bacterium]